MIDKSPRVSRFMVAAQLACFLSACQQDDPQDAQTSGESESSSAQESQSQTSSPDTSTGQTTTTQSTTSTQTSSTSDDESSSSSSSTATTSSDSTTSTSDTTQTSDSSSSESTSTTSTSDDSSTSETIDDEASFASCGHYCDVAVLCDVKQADQQVCQRECYELRPEKCLAQWRAVNDVVGTFADCTQYDAWKVPTSDDYPGKAEDDAWLACIGKQRHGLSFLVAR